MNWVTRVDRRNLRLSSCTPDGGVFLFELSQRSFIQNKERRDQKKMPNCSLCNTSFTDTWSGTLVMTRSSTKIKKIW